MSRLQTVQTFSQIAFFANWGAKLNLEGGEQQQAVLDEIKTGVDPDALRAVKGEAPVKRRNLATKGFDKIIGGLDAVLPEQDPNRQAETGPCAQAEDRQVASEETGHGE